MKPQGNTHHVDAVAQETAPIQHRHFGGRLSVADFSHTVLWGGISSVKDANGQAISQFSALSATSGFDYAMSAVPEPGTGALFALGLAALRGRRRASSRLAGVA